jgi:hypothetical protein
MMAAGVSVGVTTSTNPKRSRALEIAEDAIGRELREMVSTGQFGERTFNVKVKDGLIYSLRVTEEKVINTSGD